MVAVLAFAFSLLFGRLVYLQVLAGPGFAHAAHLEDSSTLVLLPQRGEITDRNGRLLAIETAGDALYAMPKQIRNPAQLAAQVAPILGRPVDWVRRALTAHVPFIWLSYHITAQQAARISALGTFDGLGLQPADWRAYPQGNLAGAAIGFVGVDQQGLAGIEESYNQLLSGRPGKRIFHVDALGNPLPQLPSRTVPAVPGDSLQTTLDLSIQAFAQQDLGAAVRHWKAKGGRIVVLDPKTGGILAVAQWPEPSPANWQSYPMQDWADQPVEYAFEPGSTIKPFTASAALATSVATPASVFHDPGHITIDGVRIYDWIRQGFGRLSFDGIMAESSDVAFSELAMRIGAQRYYHYLHLFHLDRPTGIDLPGESSGLVPPIAQATKLDLAEMGFGQTIAITPVQLAAAVAAVADGGVWHPPHMGLAVTSPDGQRRTLPFPGTRVVSATVAQEVQQAMLAVVQRGTGNLARVPGYVIAGKTGTANIPSSKGGFHRNAYLSSFVGYGPVPGPRALILVQIDDPQGAFYGGDVAAPLFSQLMGQILNYLGVPPNLQLLRPVSLQAPNLIAHSYGEAALIAGSSGLSLTTTGSGSVVVGQTPKVGAPILPGGTITVQLGGPKHPLGVPDVLGLTAEEALRALQQQGYGIRIVGAGVAAHESPAPGTALARGARVTVYFAPPP